MIPSKPSFRQQHSSRDWKHWTYKIFGITLKFGLVGHFQFLRASENKQLGNSSPELGKVQQVGQNDDETNNETMKTKNWKNTLPNWERHNCSMKMMTLYKNHVLGRHLEGGRGGWWWWCQLGWRWCQVTDRMRLYRKGMMASSLKELVQRGEQSLSFFFFFWGGGGVDIFAHLCSPKTS